MNYKSEVDIMAGEHIFEQPEPDRYRLVMHFNVPGGNNSAGVSWSDVLEHAGISKKTELRPSTKAMVDSGETEMVDSGEVDGNGDPIMIEVPIMVEQEVVDVGQISDAEHAEIMAGTKIELSGLVKLDGDPSVAAVNKLSERFWNDWSKQMAEKYRYYGHTQE